MDNTTHVSNSAPHIKCAALQRTNGSQRFGTWPLSFLLPWQGNTILSISLLLWPQTELFNTAQWQRCELQSVKMTDGLQISPSSLIKNKKKTPVMENTPCVPWVPCVQRNGAGCVDTRWLMRSAKQEHNSWQMMVLKYVLSIVFCDKLRLERLFCFVRSL